MDSAALRRLIEQVIAQVLGEMAAEASSAGKGRPLVLMTGTISGIAVIHHQLNRLQAELGPVTAVLSESFRVLVAPETFTQDTGITDVRLSLTRDDAERLTLKSSMLLVGTLSENSRAKMAAGISDSIPSVLWTAARATGIPLFIAEPPPLLITPATPPLPPARVRLREEQLGVLREDGATTLPAGEVFTKLQRYLVERADPVAAKRLREAGPRPIITVEDVERAHRRGVQDWDVPKDAIVTAAAWDCARELGMTMSGGNLA